MYWKIFGIGMLCVYAIQIISSLLAVMNIYVFKKERIEIFTGRAIWLAFYFGMFFVSGMFLSGIAIIIK